MERGEVERLLEKYDFAESTVLDVRWSADFRDLELKVVYFWDLAWPEPSRPAEREQPMAIRLAQCVWAAFNSSEEYCSSGIERTQVSVLGWSIDSDVARDLGDREDLKGLLGRGYHYVFFAADMEPAVTWLQAICREVIVTRI